MIWRENGKRSWSNTMIYQTWPVKNIGPYLEFHLKYAYAWSGGVWLHIRNRKLYLSRSQCCSLPWWSRHWEWLPWRRTRCPGQRSSSSRSRFLEKRIKLIGVGTEATQLQMERIIYGSFSWIFMAQESSNKIPPVIDYFPATIVSVTNCHLSLQTSVLHLQ